MSQPSQEELDKTIEELLVNAFKLGMLDALGGKGKPDPMPALREQGANIKSAINSLTLKQVLSLIGEDEYHWNAYTNGVAFDLAMSPEMEANHNRRIDTRNEFRAELRQSAERIWS